MPAAIEVLYSETLQFLWLTYHNSITVKILINVEIVRLIDGVPAVGQCRHCLDG